MRYHSSRSDRFVLKSGPQTARCRVSEPLSEPFHPFAPTRAVPRLGHILGMNGAGSQTDDLGRRCSPGSPRADLTGRRGWTTGKTIRFGLRSIPSVTWSPSGPRVTPRSCGEPSSCSRVDPPPTIGRPRAAPPAPRERDAGGARYDLAAVHRSALGSMYPPACRRDRR